MSGARRLPRYLAPATRLRRRRGVAVAQVSAGAAQTRTGSTAGPRGSARCRRRARLLRRLRPRPVSDRLFGGQLVRRAPLTFQWLGLSSDCSDPRRHVDRVARLLGAGGVALSMLAAAAGAASAPMPRAYRGPAARIYLWIVDLLGPEPFAVLRASASNGDSSPRPPAEITTVRLN